MDYLYGNLNKLVEAQKYSFTSSDDTIFISNTSNNIDLNINNQKLVKLLQVRKDLNPTDDAIKYYALFAYNPSTNKFDMQLGEEIKVNALSIPNDGNPTPIINNIQMLIGETPIFDENGVQIGTVPKYAEVKTSVTDSGTLIMSQLPASAIADKEYSYDEEGNQVEILIESTLDGNVGGEVY